MYFVVVDGEDGVEGLEVGDELGLGEGEGEGLGLGVGVASGSLTIRLAVSDLLL